MNCQHCQPLLLDHLYGLLNGPEAAAVDAHLAACEACAAARAETARVQGLIARAAKSAFPAMRFEAPAAPTQADTRPPAPLAGPKPDPVAKPTRTFRVGTVLPWAVAAAVLIAIPGTVVPVLNMFDRAAGADAASVAARREAERLAGGVENVRADARRRLSAAEYAVTVAEQSQNALLARWVEAQKVAVESATARKLTVDVRKPATVQPGAPNDFVVVVNDRREQWERSGKKMVAEVHAVNASDAVIYTQPLDSERAADKTHPLRLPAGAWTRVKPDAELFLVVAQVDEKTQTRTELLERVRLAGPVFATLLVTDKAAYRPGERLFFRSLTLDRVTLRPPGREQVLRYDLLHPDGRPVSGLSVRGTTDLVRVAPEGRVESVRAADGQPVRGVGCGEFVLPPDLADGDYHLVLREHLHPGGFPATVPAPVARTVKVRAGAADAFRKQVGFVRGSFAPGETVEAWAELAFRDKPVPNATVLGVTAQVDGRVIEGVEAAKVTNAAGRADFKFALPDAVLNGDVRVMITFRTPRGTEEVVARRVPVVGSRLVVEFFPECGDTVVAGVPCKVYVRATTPAGTPVDVRGVVTDGRRELARVEALTDRDEPGANRGLASFTYTPQLGTRVWLKLESPAGSYAPILPEAPVPNATVALLGGAGGAATRTGYALPMPKVEGVVMTVLDPVTAPGEPVRVRLHSVGQPRSLVVGAYTRGRLSDTQRVTVDPELPQTVSLMAGADPRGGVVRVTAFEEIEGREKGKVDEAPAELRPVAERLVFRRPGEVLKLTCAAAPAIAPGSAVPVAPTAPNAAAPAFAANSAVNLSLSATDETGRAVAAILWAAAVNTGAAPGPQDRLMPTHFLLAGEVKHPDDLEYADFLLTDHPRAAEALDLLLGTQGWRRFAEQVVPLDEVRVKAAAVQNKELNRLQSQNGQYATWTEPAPVRDHRKLYEQFGPRYEAAVQAVSRAKVALEETRTEDENSRSVREAAAAAASEAAKRAAEEEAVRADAAREPVQQFRSGAWYGAFGLAALALCCGAFAVARPVGRFPLGFSTAGSIGLAAFLIVAAGWGEDARAATKDAVPAVGERENTVTMAEPPRPNEPQLASSATDSRPAGEPVAGAAEAANPAGGKSAKPDVKSAGEGGGFGTSSVPGGAGGGLGGGTPPTAPRPSPRGPAGPQVMGPVAGVRMPEPKAAPRFAPSPAPALAPASAPAETSPPPRAVPYAAPGRGGGWEPYRYNGVPQAIIDASQPPAHGALASDPRADRTVARADEVKRAAERAAAYASDRANDLTAAMEPYIQRHSRAKTDEPGAAAAQSADGNKAQHVERFVYQQILGALTPAPPLVVREYAAPRPTASEFAEDAPDTVLWQPVIVLPSDGKATLNFHLGAAPGGYRVVVAGHTADGRLGAVRGLILTAPPKTSLPLQPTVPAGSVPPVVPVAPAKPPAP